MIKNWLYQLILGLVSICHSSYRGVVELFRDLFDMPISVGTVHNRLHAMAEKAAEIIQSQDLADIKVGLQDEIFQPNKPILVCVDAASTYCFHDSVAKTGSASLSVFNLRTSAILSISPMPSSQLFKWRRFQPDLILLNVRWYLRDGLSYRDLEEMMLECGVKVDHTTIYRWVQAYSPELDRRCRRHLKPANDSWRVDATYIKVKGVRKVHFSFQIVLKALAQSRYYV